MSKIKSKKHTTPGAAKTSRPKRYDAGKGRKVTVPENDEGGIFAAIREELSPQAVAAIVAYLQPAATKDRAVNQELAWFSRELAGIVGGYEEQGRLAEEVGL